MPPTKNHNVMKELVEKAGTGDQTQFIMMEFRDLTRTDRPDTPAPNTNEGLFCGGDVDV